MNFSYFDYLKESDYRLAACIRYCSKAERYARTNPGDTAIYARQALENLFINQSSIHNLNPSNLSDSIKQNCLMLESDNELVRQKADSIRRQGNNAVHPQRSKDMQAKIANIDSVTEENVKRAVQVVNDLYDLLRLLHGKQDCPTFDKDKVPFGGYHIIRKVDVPEGLNRESYFVHDDRGIVYYLQCLSFADEQDLESRRLEAENIIYDRIHKQTNRILTASSELLLPEESDRKILIHKVYRDSILLSEIRDHDRSSGLHVKKLTLQQALRIILDLIDALETMKTVGIHHRNIYPGSILLNNEDGQLRAYLLNLQTSKIIDSSYTVNAALAASHSLNFYLPPLPDGVTPDWEKVDVYALCKVFLYCLSPKLTTVDRTALFNKFIDFTMPDPILKLYKRIFQTKTNLAALPSLSEVKEVFLNEYSKQKSV